MLNAAPLRLIAAKDIAAGDVVELVSAFVPVEDDAATGLPDFEEPPDVPPTDGTESNSPNDDAGTAEASPVPAPVQRRKKLEQPE